MSITEILPAWVAIVGIVGGTLTILGAFGAAWAVMRSRYRKGLDEEREEFIRALKERNEQLEQALERQRKELEGTKRLLHQMEGKLNFLRDLVLGKCKEADIDPATGICRHCELCREEEG